MSNILIITSSYRKKSNSSLLAAAVAKGATGRGHSARVLDIGRLNIASCRGCEACQKPGANFCVIKDDMHPLYPAVRDADALIFASPVYWFNLCGQIKQFIDRCHALSPISEKKIAFSNKKMGALLTYGGEDVFDSGGVNALRSLQDICAYAESTWIGAVCATAEKEGEVANNPELLAKAEAYGASF